MKMTLKRRLSSTAIGLGLALCALGPVAAHADRPGDHPAYLHALSDLRSARWLIEHRVGDWKRTMDEGEAVRQIDVTIAELKKAAIDDGKNINDRPEVDERPDQRGRLHDAVEFLKKARADIEHDEDNYTATHLRDRAIGHIDNAIHSVRHAINE